MALVDQTPDLQTLRRLRSRRDVDQLDYLRSLRRVASSGMTQTALARGLGITQPSVSNALAQADKLADVRPGFSGASPYEIAQRYTAGEISREQLVDELSRWPYVEGRLADDVDWTTAEPGEWNDTVGRALDDGLLDDETYDEILHRITSTTP